MWEPLELQYEEGGNHNRTISKILDGTQAALIIKNFYDEKSCRIMTDRITDVSYFDYGSGIIKKVGIFLLGYINQKSKYFDDAQNADKTLGKIFYGMEDPRKKIHNFLSNLFPSKNIHTAKEAEGPYSAGIIRIHEKDDYAPLHRDNAKFDAREFCISYFDQQLSCVLYLQQPENGGELVIHREQWEKPDEKFRKIDFGYLEKVVSECSEYTKIKPHTGDLIIFNPNHFHKILPVSGDLKRITFSMFMAFSDYSNEVVTWS